MSGRERLRSFFIALAAAIVASMITVFAGAKNPTVILAVTLLTLAAVWGLTEWAFRVLRPLMNGIRFRSPIARRTAPEDLGTQVEALMGMPLHRWPVIRARVATWFNEMKLSASERSVLVMWASYALEGKAELDYHVDAFPGERPFWLLNCSNRNEHPPRRLDGVITCYDSEMPNVISTTHKTMVNILRNEPRPAGW
jgi:hypothetical protein